MAEIDLDAFMSHFDEPTWPHGTLPDGCIGPTDMAGWRRLLDALRASPWRLENEPGPDADLEAMFGPDSELATIKVFVGQLPVQVNVFVLERTSIHFDFATAEMVDQEAVDSLADFIRLASQAAQAPCELTPEGFGTHVVARYDPVLDEFSVESASP